LNRHKKRRKYIQLAVKAISAEFWKFYCLYEGIRLISNESDFAFWFIDVFGHMFIIEVGGNVNK
jgi:hypothetical protein